MIVASRQSRKLRPTPFAGCRISMAEFHQPGIPQSQRSWSILLQTVPGASRSVFRRPHLRFGMPSAGTPAIAAWLEPPAPDRARSVSLRLPDISSPWQNANRRAALLSKTAGTAILRHASAPSPKKNSTSRKKILRPAKKNVFPYFKQWVSALHFRVSPFPCKTNFPGKTNPPSANNKPRADQ